MNSVIHLEPVWHLPCSCTATMHSLGLCFWSPSIFHPSFVKIRPKMSLNNDSGLSFYVVQFLSQNNSEYVQAMWHCVCACVRVNLSARLHSLKRFITRWWIKMRETDWGGVGSCFRGRGVGGATHIIGLSAWQCLQCGWAVACWFTHTRHGNMHVHINFSQLASVKTRAFLKPQRFTHDMTACCETGSEWCKTGASVNRTTFMSMAWLHRKRISMFFCVSLTHLTDWLFLFLRFELNSVSLISRFKGPQAQQTGCDHSTAESFNQDFHTSQDLQLEARFFFM